MLNNEWAMTVYPVVGGYEAVGEITAAGENVKSVKVGDKVGLGWNAETRGHCKQCMAGYRTNCPQLVGTIVGRHGNYKMSQINEAFEYLESGKARYRIVLENDF